MELLSENAQVQLLLNLENNSKQQNLGLPMRDARCNFYIASLRPICGCWSPQSWCRGTLAATWPEFGSTVFVIRERLRIRGVRVQTAQGRLTGSILSALPLVMLVLLKFEPDIPVSCSAIHSAAS